ncbi:MAG: hypothetical protein HC897_07470 [Thermoanaerobaculia bacterium]|nr:hypothetical protein [Thermoanaerobaculia bacterium]
MERKILWVFFMLLLGTDVFLVLQRDHLNDMVKSLAEENSNLADRNRMLSTKATYIEEEDNIITNRLELPEEFPWRPNRSFAGPRFHFKLLASTADCTNCIESEVIHLNQIATMKQNMHAGNVQAFFVDEERLETAERFIANLSPKPLFPFSVRNVLPYLPGATTPLVLVVRSHDGMIVDAHKPIPEDLLRSEAFYARWAGVLELQ